MAQNKPRRVLQEPPKDSPQFVPLQISRSVPHSMDELNTKLGLKHSPANVPAEAGASGITAGGPPMVGGSSGSSTTVLLGGGQSNAAVRKSEKSDLHKHKTLINTVSPGPISPNEKPNAKVSEKRERYLSQEVANASFPNAKHPDERMSLSTIPRALTGVVSSTVVREVRSLNETGSPSDTSGVGVSPATGTDVGATDIGVTEGATTQQMNQESSSPATSSNGNNFRSLGGEGEGNSSDTKPNLEKAAQSNTTNAGKNSNSSSNDDATTRNNNYGGKNDTFAGYHGGCPVSSDQLKISFGQSSSQPGMISTLATAITSTPPNNMKATMKATSTPSTSSVSQNVVSSGLVPNQNVSSGLTNVSSTTLPQQGSTKSVKMPEEDSLVARKTEAAFEGRHLQDAQTELLRHIEFYSIKNKTSFILADLGKKYDELRKEELSKLLSEESRKKIAHHTYLQYAVWCVSKDDVRTIKTMVKARFLSLDDIKTLQKIGKVIQTANARLMEEKAAQDDVQVAQDHEGGSKDGTGMTSSKSSTKNSPNTPKKSPNPSSTLLVGGATAGGNSGTTGIPSSPIGTLPSPPNTPGVDPTKLSVYNGDAVRYMETLKLSNWEKGRANSIPSIANVNPIPQPRPGNPDVYTDTTVYHDRYVIIMVGLPARGKTYLSRRLARYLDFFHGVQCKIFNVGDYRRLYCGAELDASFFDHKNESNVSAREEACHAAMSDLIKWMTIDEKPRVGFFDATNSKKERRLWCLKTIKRDIKNVKILFLESIVTDPKIVEQNIRAVKLGNPDFRNMESDKAFREFVKRIGYYSEVYTSIDETDETEEGRSMWIKVINLNRHVVNNIKGFLPTQMVQFLLHLNVVDQSRNRCFYLTRHGQSEYNEAGKIGGDSSLSRLGEMYAKELAKYARSTIAIDQETGLAVPARLWTSTLKRTIETSRHIPQDEIIHDRRADNAIKSRSASPNDDLLGGADNPHRRASSKSTRSASASSPNDDPITPKSLQKASATGGGVSTTSERIENFSLPLVTSNTPLEGGHVGSKSSEYLMIEEEAGLSSNQKSDTRKKEQMTQHGDNIIDSNFEPWRQFKRKEWRNLDELYAGTYDGLTYEEIQALYPEEFEDRQRNKLTYRYPRGESYTDVIHRVHNVILEMERCRERLLIIGHQGILRILFAYWMGLKPEEAVNISIPLNTIVKLSPGVYSCQEERIQLIKPEDVKKMKVEWLKEELNLRGEELTDLGREEFKRLEDLKKYSDPLIFENFKKSLLERIRKNKQNTNMILESPPPQELVVEVDGTTIPRELVDGTTIIREIDGTIREGNQNTNVNTNINTNVNANVNGIIGGGSSVMGGGSSVMGGGSLIMGDHSPGSPSNDRLVVANGIGSDIRCKDRIPSHTKLASTGSYKHPESLTSGITIGGTNSTNSTFGHIKSKLASGITHEEGELHTRNLSSIKSSRSKSPISNKVVKSPVTKQQRRGWNNMGLILMQDFSLTASEHSSPLEKFESKSGGFDSKSNSRRESPIRSDIATRNKTYYSNSPSGGTTLGTTEGITSSDKKIPGALSDLLQDMDTTVNDIVVDSSTTVMDSSTPQETNATSTLIENSFERFQRLEQIEKMLDPPSC